MSMALDPVESGARSPFGVSTVRVSGWVKEATAPAKNLLIPPAHAGGTDRT